MARPEKVGTLKHRGDILPAPGFRAMTPDNNRRDTRVAARVTVVVLRGKNASTYVTRDVSYRGLFVCTEEPPALRSLVRLRVSLPGHTFEAHAMAVHIVEDIADQASGVGLQFWGLSGPDRKAWDDYVSPLVKAAQVASKKNQLTIRTPHPAGTEPVSGVRVVASVPQTGSGNR
jgi:hypothetical protein